MAFEKGKRLGGRGCPNCGSHNTEAARASKKGLPGAHWCMDCEHRWLPCAVSCRGYKIFMPIPRERVRAVPAIRGCPECGVPDRLALYWPEAYRALAGELDELKSRPISNLSPKGYQHVASK